MGMTAIEKVLAEYDLVETGGSDFHGNLNPEIQMGKGSGDLFVKYDVYQRLIDKEDGSEGVRYGPTSLSSSSRRSGPSENRVARMGGSSGSTKKNI